MYLYIVYIYAIYRYYLYTYILVYYIYLYTYLSHSLSICLPIHQSISLSIVICTDELSKSDTAAVSRLIVKLLFSFMKLSSLLIKKGNQ